MAGPNVRQGPAPVARMSVDPMDLDDTTPAVEETDNDKAAGQPKIMFRDEAGLSDTESSDDDDSDPDIRWGNLPGQRTKSTKLRKLDTQVLVNEAKKRKPLSSLQTDPAVSTIPNMAPPVERVNPLTGNNYYVDWIPYWSNPDWNDSVYLFDHKGPTGEYMYGLVRSADRQRPALLPEDAGKNPTPYAQRFGIAPGHESDGRSRMSPTTSTTRYAPILLERVAAIGSEDIKTNKEARDFLDAVVASDPGSASEGIINFLLDDEGAEEHISAFRRRIRGVMEEDEAYQQVAFQNVTTDERVYHDIHSDDKTAVAFDELQGPLSTLLTRDRWLSEEGGTREEPRYHYNVNNKRGEWSAQKNDEVWELLQPVLQLLTRLLMGCTDHPFFHALLDPKSRRYVDEWRRPGKSSKKKKWVSFGLDFNKGTVQPDQLGAEHFAVLDKHNFNVHDVAHQFLLNRLKLRLCSSQAAGWKKGELFNENLLGWGYTHIKPMPDPHRAEIIIDLGAEVLWPLLMDNLTHKEKASCIMIAAATLLHEICHAIQFSTRFILQAAKRKRHDERSPLYGQPPEVLAALQGLHELLYDDWDPYFEDEPRKEVGFAFEKLLFGGSVVSAFSQGRLTYGHYTALPLGLQLDPWPTNNPLPRDNNDDTQLILKSPPLPVDGVSVLLPTKDYTKFFSQAFWDTQVPKYGLQALKLGPNNNSITTLKRNYIRRKDMAFEFGRVPAQFILEALDRIKELGHTLLLDYLRGLLEEKMEPVFVRKRFHFECRLWPQRVEAFQKIMDKVGHHLLELDEAWKDLEPPRWKTGRVAGLRRKGKVAARMSREHNRQLLKRLNKELDGLVVIMHQVHHHLLHEIRCIQTLVVDYVQQPPKNRVRLYRRYMGPLHMMIEQVYESSVTRICSDLSDILARLRRDHSLSADTDDVIRRITHLLVLDSKHLSRSKWYLREDKVDADGLSFEDVLETIPRGRAKKKSANMKGMAVKEMLRLPKPVKDLINQVLDYVDERQGDGEMRDEDMEEEAAVVFGKIKENLKPAQPPRGLQVNGRGPVFWREPPTPEATPRGGATPVWGATEPVWGATGPVKQPWTTWSWKKAPTPPPESRNPLFGSPLFGIPSFSLNNDVGDEMDIDDEEPASIVASEALLAETYAASAKPQPMFPAGRVAPGRREPSVFRRRDTKTPPRRRSWSPMDVDVPTFKIDDDDPVRATRLRRMRRMRFDDDDDPAKGTRLRRVG